MKLDLRNIKPEGGRYAFSELAQDLDLGLEGYEFPDAIEVRINTAKSGDEIIVQGQIRTIVEMECARCLEVFEMDIEPRLQFVIQLLEISEPQHSDDEDFVILPKTMGEFDLSDRVREVIILDLPIKPLCSEHCRGLCPMCGINLNDAECECTPDKTDERWDSLKQLFGD